MEPHEIYENLYKKGVSARLIADVLNVSNQSVSGVIRSGRGSKRIAEAIAKVLDKPLITVFPYYKPKQNRSEKISILKQILNSN